MDRIHHVKMVSHDPKAVEEFLTEVVRVPKGWALGAPLPERTGEAAGTGEALDWDTVFRVRAADEAGGLMLGDGTSRQFQLLKGDESHLWSVAIATRDLEGAAARAVERGIPVTEPRLFEFEKESVRAFFARVGGLLFEVMRVEPGTGSTGAAVVSEPT